MTPKQHRSLGKYVIEMAARFGLRDWTIIYDSSPPEDGVLGHTAVTYGQQLATLKFVSDFNTHPPDVQRSTVVHELIHVHTLDQLAIIQETLPDLLGKPAYSVFYEAFRLAMEQGTDAIAVAIAPHFPLWDAPK